MRSDEEIIEQLRRLHYRTKLDPYALVQLYLDLDVILDGRNPRKLLDVLLIPVRTDAVTTPTTVSEELVRSVRNSPSRRRLSSLTLSQLIQVQLRLALHSRAWRIVTAEIARRKSLVNGA